MKEVEEVIKSLKKGKLAGKDEVQNDARIYRGEKVKEAVWTGKYGKERACQRNGGKE